MNYFWLKFVTLSYSRTWVRCLVDFYTLPSAHDVNVMAGVNENKSFSIYVNFQVKHTLDVYQFMWLKQTICRGNITNETSHIHI